MKKIMIGVSLGLAGMAGMSEAYAWNGGIEDMRTMQSNAGGQVVRVKSSTTDCCTLRPMQGHGHSHQRKMIHNGQTYYCTRVAVHGQQVSHHAGKVKQHYQRQTQQVVNANVQRAQRQAVYVAQAKQKALLLAQQRQRAVQLEAQKRKAVLLAQQKQRAAHQVLMQAQQRKRVDQQLQQQRKLQLLAQQRRLAAQHSQRMMVVAKPAPRYYQPPPRQHTVIEKPRYDNGGYERYHYPSSAPQAGSQPPAQHHEQWLRSESIRMQPIQNVVKAHARKRPAHGFSVQQAVDRHEAAGWQRAATVQSHGMQRQVIASNQ